jgi:hypothetical protein
VVPVPSNVTTASINALCETGLAQSSGRSTVAAPRPPSSTATRTAPLFPTPSDTRGAPVRHSPAAARIRTPRRCKAIDGLRGGAESHQTAWRDERTGTLRENCFALGAVVVPLPFVAGPQIIYVLLRKEVDAGRARGDIELALIPFARRIHDRHLGPDAGRARTWAVVVHALT